MARKRIIKGVSVSPGLALGPVHVVRATADVVPLWCVPGEDVEREIGRLRAALATASTELERRQRIVAGQAGEKDAEIFAVHRMILQDPSALREVESTLRDQRINAEAAVQALVDRYRTALSSLEGDNIRNYAADVTDPWRIVLDSLMKREREDFASTGEKVVLAAKELTPQVMTYIERDRILAVVSESGGRFSHGAVLARSFGLPCVVDVANLLSRLEQGLRVIVDGDQGTVQLRPDEADIDKFLEARDRRSAREEALAAHATLPAVTPDGQPFGVSVNVESLRDLDTFDIAQCDGVGLLRTEFLYLERKQFPSEEEQYRLYRRVVERMEGRPVTLRTLDIGGDKPLPYFNTPHEKNPVLGWRGLRITLEWPDLLHVQLRAAMRAAAHGPLRLLLPMVTSLEEVHEVRIMAEGIRRQLVDQGYELGPDIQLGVMVEVPACLLALPAIIEEVDFVSVGTNDLVQYLLAVDRDNPLVANRYDPQHPAVMWALRHVAEVAQRAGKPCTVCGEVAGDHATALMLLGMGYDAVSVAPNFIPLVKYAVRETPYTEALEVAGEIASQRTTEGVRLVLQALRQRLHDRQVDQNARESRGQESAG